MFNYRRHSTILNRGKGQVDRHPGTLRAIKGQEDCVTNGLAITWGNLDWMLGERTAMYMKDRACSSSVLLNIPFLMQLLSWFSVTYCSSFYVVDLIVHWFLATCPQVLQELQNILVFDLQTLEVTAERPLPRLSVASNLRIEFRTDSIVNVQVGLSKICMRCL